MTVFEKEPRKIGGFEIPGTHKTTDRPLPVEGRSYPIIHSINDPDCEYPPEEKRHAICIFASTDRRTITFYEIDPADGPPCLERGRSYQLSGSAINGPLSPVRGLVEFKED